MKDYRFWNHSINPITGFVIRREQLDDEVTRINALHIKRGRENNQIDLEDMINEVIELETFKNN
jgi:hypothetical protein